MKKLVLIALTIMLSACSVDRSLEATVTANDGRDGRDGIDGTSAICTVERQENGALLSCSDGSYAFVQDGSNGSNGQNGENGSDGQDGNSCSVEQQEGGALITCGNSSALVQNGLNGTNGQDGQDGQDGEDGEDGDDGTLISLADYSGSSCTKIVGTSSYVKKNGSNYKLYTSSSCSSSSAFAEVSQGEAYWAASNVLAVHADSKLRVIIFN